MNPDLQHKLDMLPEEPGVYLMRGAAEEVLYIGKAKNLRERLRAYLSGSDNRAFVALLDNVWLDLEVVITSTEKEALLLENELIKQYRPRFNVKLTDDKRYLCLRLSTTHPYPKLELVRRFGHDKARYFGPYHSASAIRESLRIVNRHFQLRTCSDEVLRTRKRPCLQYQIKRCPAPCVYDLSQGQYRTNVSHVVAFLEGRGDELVRSLEQRMRHHAAKLEFEHAAQLRDQLRAVNRSMERQRVVTADFVDRDVVGLSREGPFVEIHIMRVRNGRPIEAQRFSLDDTELPTSEVLADFAARYYVDTQASQQVPTEILFPPEMQWAQALQQALSERLGRTVRVLTPKRGDKLRLVQLAKRNAEQSCSEARRQTVSAQQTLERLKQALHLRQLPQRLECIDISHLQGQQIVASVVCLEQGSPDKRAYRHYKIRSTQQQDDFQSIYEVLSRRVRRGLTEGDLPNLFVIDGGKGQLSAARAALDDFGVDQIDLIALAKSRLNQEDPSPSDGPASYANSELSRSPERVFVDGHKNPIVLRQNSAELLVLTRARDEAHRFAISFHRRLRQKAARRSALDDIPGVGPKRRQALLRTFGSVARLRQADQEAIARVIGKSAAIQVMDHLKENQSES
ncbi:MAG: excinuclease ABC subunit UvrC [Myxococcota bacterium]